MKNQIIIDNWSLFDIKELMTNGVSEKQVGTAIFKGNDYSVEFQPQLLIQIKVLLHFLNDLVTRDTFLIDTGKKHQWSGQFELLDKIDEKGIIEDIEEKETAEDYKNIQIIRESFGTPEKAKKALNLQRLLIHEHYSYFSNVINGSAKYLNKSSKVEAPYSPHPFRTSFLKQTIFPDFQDANYELKHWVMKERENLIEKINKDSEMRIGLVPIDPIVIEIIENSKDPNDLIRVALQMRGEYRKFRKYLNTYQEAINEGNLKELREHRRLLDDIHNKVIDFKDPEKYGKFSISLGFGLFKYSKSIPIIDKLLMRKGIRATLQRLIMKSGSKNTIQKLLLMFDVKDKELTNQLMEKLKK